MRAILMLILLAAIILLVLVMTDVVNIRQTDEARAPAIEIDEGRLPEFDVDTADIELGTERRSVEVDVPAVRMRGAEENGEREAAETAEREPAEPAGDAATP
ncbi:MAG: hypothetical protein ABR601_08370 [Parasphingopyxis sp.]